MNVFELNKYLRKTHTGLSNKDKRGIKFTSHQERELVGYCESMLDYVNKLGTINKTLPIEQQQKEKRKIIDQINARLVEYEEEVENKRSCWKTAKEAKEATGKELWTIHRYGRSGKIPSTQHFLRKIHYFVPDK